MPTIHNHIGSVPGGLGASLEKAQKVLLVTGKGSYDTTNIRDIIEGELYGREVVRISNFSPNPKFSDLSRILIEEVKDKFDAVITIGGGSVLDMGKLIYFFAGKDEKFIESYLSGEHKDYESSMTSPLISIPTTAGTGSESTHFAVLYDNSGTKYSVAHASLLPSEVFLDATLLSEISLDVLGPTILDSLCQCIESYWSIHATPESREYARKGLLILKGELETISQQAVINPKSKQQLLEASNYSGQAINISKTTASHAVSYPITSKYGVPHGHAVALTLGHMFKFNSEVTPDSPLNGNGNFEDLQKTIRDILDIFGCNDADDFIEYMRGIMTKLGLKFSLSELGIDDIEYIIENGFNPQRVVNNPRKLDRDSLKAMLINLG